jgi:hypothetical protein
MIMGSRHRNIRVFEFQDSWIPVKAGIQKKAPPTRQGLSDMSELTTEPKKGFYSSLVSCHSLLITCHFYLSELFLYFGPIRGAILENGEISDEINVLGFFESGYPLPNKIDQGLGF